MTLIHWISLDPNTICRPKRNNYDLNEFLEPDDESVITRQFIQGHNRLYFHSPTVQPVRPNEIDDDSEDEVDPEWLRQKTILVS